jgi:hypothetical protein
MDREHIQSDRICLSCGKAMGLARTTPEIGEVPEFAQLRMQRVRSRIYGKRGDGRVARELNPLALATAGKQCQPVDAADTNGRCAKRESISEHV